MEPFQLLGDEIEALWREKNYNETDLPAIAADALRRARLHERISAWDAVEWSLQQRELPPQRDVTATFGDPPITLYVGPRFYIDIYFWFEGTTAIHQHGFCGAFQVLLGSSIHSWYEFDRREVINTFCEIGDISLKVCEILEVGAVQEIWAGRGYIHSLFHLEQPSATIVIRTDKSPLHLPQFSYQKPSLATDPFFEQNTTTKKIQIVSALIRARHPDADRLISAWLDESDLHTAFTILTRLHTLLGSSHLEQLFKLETPKARFDKFLGVVADRHATAGEAFRAAFAHMDMQNEILARRSYVTEPEHRFFMALLLNVDGRERIFSLIKQRFPDADPIEKVLDWVFDLAQTRVVGIENPNALGIADFGDVEMFALENMLKGKTADAVAAAYAEENPGSDAAVVKGATDKILASVIFRPLLV